jgi:hypothetical protein
MSEAAATINDFVTVTSSRRVTEKVHDAALEKVEASAVLLNRVSMPLDSGPTAQTSAMRLRTNVFRDMSALLDLTTRLGLKQWIGRPWWRGRLITVLVPAVVLAV